MTICLDGRVAIATGVSHGPGCAYSFGRARADAGRLFAEMHGGPAENAMIRRLSPDARLSAAACGRIGTTRGITPRAARAVGYERGRTVPASESARKLREIAELEGECHE